MGSKEKCIYQNNTCGISSQKISFLKKMSLKSNFFYLRVCFFKSKGFFLFSVNSKRAEMFGFNYNILHSKRCEKFTSLLKNVIDVLKFTVNLKNNILSANKSLIFPFSLHFYPTVIILREFFLYYICKQKINTNLQKSLFFLQ